jgi:APA family basic amino acid/polyamine antiporter
MSEKLQKTLKLRHVFSISAGAMISSGIFILPGVAFSSTGPSLFLSYGIAGFIALIGVLSIIELATAMPKAGGDYYFIGRTFGPLMGTVTGTLSWFSLSLKTAFAVFGLSEILFLITGISPMIWGLSLTLFFVALNLMGVEGAANLEVVLVAGLITVMGGFVIFGAPRVDFERFRPFFTLGVNGMLSTAAFVFVSFGGLLQVATIAEEVKDPQKSLQQGTFLAVGVVTLLYMSIVTVTTGLLDGAEFRESLTPVADAAAVISGRAGRIILSAAASLAFITTALAGLMSASRYPLALARDGLLPRFLSVVSRKKGTPGPSIVLTGILVAVSLQLNLGLLVKSASAVFMITYILANIAVIVLRESRLSNYKPLFIAPFYPWPQALSILLYLFFLADMGWEAFAIALGFVSLSLLIFHLYGRHRVDHDFALVHLLKRVVDTRWRDEGLEKELLGIITMRDRVPIDSMPCVDLDDSVVLLDDLWRRVAKDLSLHIKVPTETLEDALRERDRQYSTALTPFTAIPHVVLDGDTRQFAVLCYRSRIGIRFSESAAAVHAIFVCAGTGDIRHLHLEVLADHRPIC